MGFWENSYFQITGPYPKVIDYKDSPNYVVSKYIIICITDLGWIKGVYFFSFFLSLFIFGITECLHEVIPNINRERKKEKKSNTLYPPEVCLAFNIPTLK